MKWEVPTTSGALTELRLHTWRTARESVFLLTHVSSMCSYMGVCGCVCRCSCVYHVFLICRERLELLAASLGHICLSDIVQSSCCSTKMLHLVCINKMRKKTRFGSEGETKGGLGVQPFSLLSFCHFQIYKSEMTHQRACLVGIHFILAMHKHLSQCMWWYTHQLFFSEITELWSRSCSRLNLRCLRFYFMFVFHGCCLKGVMSGIKHEHVAGKWIVCCLILGNKCGVIEEIGSLYLVPVVLLVPVFQ